MNSLIDSLPADSPGRAAGLRHRNRFHRCREGRRLHRYQDPRAGRPARTPRRSSRRSTSVVASGYTPVGNALRAAADALPNEGPRSIVLVSDGEDTCAPPAPCDVASELHQQGIDLVIHTVGFKVDATAREQLSCIAQATGGTYSDAADASQLTQALATKVDYAITGYTTAGTPVTGADQPSAAGTAAHPRPVRRHLRRRRVGREWMPPGPRSTTPSRCRPVSVRTSRRRSCRRTASPGAFAELVGLDARSDRHRPGILHQRTRRGPLLLQGRNETATAVIDGPTFGDPDNHADCPTDGVALLAITRIGQAWADRPLRSRSSSGWSRLPMPAPCCRRHPRVTRCRRPPRHAHRADRRHRLQRRTAPHQRRHLPGHHSPPARAGSTGCRCSGDSACPIWSPRSGRPSPRSASSDRSSGSTCSIRCGPTSPEFVESTGGLWFANEPRQAVQRDPPRTRSATPTGRASNRAGSRSTATTTCGSTPTGTTTSRRRPHT